MADASIDVPEVDTSTPIRTITGTVGATTVHQQVVSLADDDMTVAEIATATPGASDPGLVVRSIPPRSSTANPGTTIDVTNAAGGEEVLAANANRIGATFFNANAATSSIYLRFGNGTGLTSAGVNAHVRLLNIGAYYELPYGYTGAVFAVSNVLNSDLSIAEFEA